MATFTTDAFLDSGVARTAGEVHTFNGGTLTVRTDTRWHANAPASMTGSFGGNSVISATLGGGLVLDARNVRWMPYTGGGGTVPAIGTTVTRGGVTGYLLGVWDSLTAAPTAVGAAMPATGFLKFREVTGGPFTAGALTGITALISLIRALRVPTTEVATLADNALADPRRPMSAALSLQPDEAPGPFSEMLERRTLESASASLASLPLRKVFPWRKCG